MIYTARTVDDVAWKLTVPHRGVSGHRKVADNNEVALLAGEIEVVRCIDGLFEIEHASMARVPGLLGVRPIIAGHEGVKMYALRGYL